MNPNMVFTWTVSEMEAVVLSLSYMLDADDGTWIKSREELETIRAEVSNALATLNAVLEGNKHD